MASTRFRAYITKYALTKGIQEVEVVDCFDVSAKMVKEIPPLPAYGQFSLPAYGQYFHDDDWHRTREEAVKKAERMRALKMFSLQKQIDKLKKMKF